MSTSRPLAFPPLYCKHTLPAARRGTVILAVCPQHAESRVHLLQNQLTQIWNCLLIRGKLGGAPVPKASSSARRTSPTHDCRHTWRLAW